MMVSVMNGFVDLAHAGQIPLGWHQSQTPPAGWDNAYLLNMLCPV
jgi:hypothetical protein